MGGSSESMDLSPSSPSITYSPETKKMVQELRELIYGSHTEIDKVLVDSNMDIDEAVKKLHSQDTFQEVKSKRQRRKEKKEIQESSPARASYNGSIQSSQEDNGNHHKGENTSVVLSLPTPSFSSRRKGKTSNSNFNISLG